MARPKEATSTTRSKTSRPSSRKSLVAHQIDSFDNPEHDQNYEPDHDPDQPHPGEGESEVIRVRRMHRRDIKRVWEFLLRVFRDVNQKTVELQRPRSRRSFEESYDNEGIEQLIFEIDGAIVGYAESTFEVTGADNWVNWRWFDARDIRPLFVEELAVSPDYQGRGVGGFMLEQLRHIGSLRGCTHLVLEVAENNEEALQFYRKRNFFKLDAAIFLAQRIDRQPELLPPRPLKPAKEPPPTRRGKPSASRPDTDGPSRKSSGSSKKASGSSKKTAASSKKGKTSTKKVPDGPPKEVTESTPEEQPSKAPKRSRKKTATA